MVNDQSDKNAATKYMFSQETNLHHNFTPFLLGQRFVFLVIIRHFKCPGNGTQITI